MIDEDDEPAKLVQLFELYLEGLLQLQQIPIEHRTAELAKIALVLNRNTVDYCLECTPFCPLYTICKRRLSPVPSPHPHYADEPPAWASVTERV